jgi:hypothetical protein
MNLQSNESAAKHLSLWMHVCIYVDFCILIERGLGKLIKGDFHIRNTPELANYSRYICNKAECFASTA